MKMKYRHLLITALLMIGPVLASAAEAPAAPGAETPEVVKESFIQVLAKGGWVMWLIAACSVAMVWLTIDVWMRTAKKRMTPDADMDASRTAFRSGDYVGAYQAMKESQSPYAQVVRSALGAIGHGKDATEEALHARVDKVNSTLQTRINYLSVIGVCAPMIGLLGTVGGMMGAFKTLGTSGIGDPSKLSAHIGEVLVATASGLFIAIPAFMCFYFLRNKLQGAVMDLEDEASALFRNSPYELLKDTDVGQEETYAAVPNWINADEAAVSA